ncbi:hypothetical protein A2U01_0034111, partial [Trifolium medium]|nr:hypothetical protein [Trifolium medium]
MVVLLHQSSVVYERALSPVREGDGGAGGDRKEWWMEQQKEKK